MSKEEAIACKVGYSGCELVATVQARSRDGQRRWVCNPCYEKLRDQFGWTAMKGEK